MGIPTRDFLRHGSCLLIVFVGEFLRISKPPLRDHSTLKQASFDGGDCSIQALRFLEPFRKEYVHLASWIDPVHGVVECLRILLLDVHLS